MIGRLQGLYYLIFEKNYKKFKNTGKQVLKIIY